MKGCLLAPFKIVIALLSLARRALAFVLDHLLGVILGAGMGLWHGVSGMVKMGVKSVIFNVAWDVINGLRKKKRS